MTDRRRSPHTVLIPGRRGRGGWPTRGQLLWYLVRLALYTALLAWLLGRFYRPACP